MASPPSEVECIFHYGVQAHALGCVPFPTAGPALSSCVAGSSPLISHCGSLSSPSSSCPAWDLAAVLTYLNSAVFEPLRLASLRSLTKKVLFLLALATVKRVGEIQALSRLVSFVRADACVSYVPEFVAKTESLSNPIPRSFLVKSLSDFAAGLHEELLLRPVRALRIYLDRTASFSFASSTYSVFIEECRVLFSL